jgi:hypothetical protein
LKKYTVHITSGITSAIWLLLTGWIALGNHISYLFDFSFLFHLIPWGIGFSEGTTILYYLAYLFTWIILSFLFSPIVKAYYSSKQKKRFLTLTVGPIIFLLLLGLYVDNKDSKKREALIASNNKKDQADFYHLKTGDLLFQILNNDSVFNEPQNSDSTYNSIGIAFIDGQNYALLETKDQVQYVSLRQWLANGKDEHYVVKRLRNADSLFTSVGIQKLKNEARNNILKKYDTDSDWSDDKMYNAELIWKIYNRSLNVEFGKLDTVKVDSITQLGIKPNTIFNSGDLMTIRRK